MKPLRLALSILLCEGVGLAGSFFTRSAIPGWYADRIRPAFAPPNWVFAPVWTLLYLLMGIVLYRLWTRPEGGAERRMALGWFFVQLALNAAWSPVFFGLKNTWLAFAIILLLLGSIVGTIRSLSRFDVLSSRLLWPYLLWVAFASAVNFEFARLNG